MSDTPDASGRTLMLGAVGAVLVLAVFQTVWAFKTKEALEEARAELAKVNRTAEALEKVEEKIEKLGNDQEFLVDDVGKVSRKIDDLKRSLEARDRAGQIEAPQG